MTQPFVVKIDLKLADKLLSDLKQQDFEISTPLYTQFAAKKEGLVCTFYSSGKLVIQGRNSADFIEFYLEPEILQTFAYRHPLAESNFISHIGIDESGKGDFFGPLCIAGVFVQAEQFPLLKDLGVKDSKTLTDISIRKIGAKIKQNCLYHLVRINPPKYNQLYSKFKNLNHLLAWGHATAIEELVQKSGCRSVIIDQFADESVVNFALKQINLAIDLTQQHRAEDDLAVAAASILARLAFIEALDKMGQELGILIPKGSSAATLKIGKEIVSRYGEQKLRSLCKEHFKTLDAILSSERK